MYTYGLIVFSEDEEKAYAKALECSGRYSQGNISMAINFADDEEYFKDTVKSLSSMYLDLKESSENLLSIYENKLDKEDFLISQLHENLKRYESHLYSYPKEWKIVIYNDGQVIHIDSSEILINFLRGKEKNHIYLFIIDAQ
ncbi:MAG TPA: hypothetical protein PLM73_01750 [Petrotogaceae bacterium]|jgi:hypothetical protein|nr:hypothetical protein [Petrotogaceae bacterium]HQF32405.1 hypothetical protein [Petrotogaceae bacterium]HQI79566.1 hypothetical protein [Petrotogaceae bacterium]